MITALHNNVELHNGIVLDLEFDDVVCDPDAARKTEEIWNINMKQVKRVVFACNYKK